MSCFILPVLFAFYFILIVSVVRSVTDRIVKIYLPFRDCAALAIIISVTNMLLFWTAMLFYAAFDKRAGDMFNVAGIFSYLFAMGVCFFADSGIYGWYITYPSTRKSIGFAKGSVIAIILITLQTVLTFAVNGVFYLLEPTPVVT